MSILDDVARALGQIFDRRFLGVLFRSLGLTVLLLALFYALVAVGLRFVLPDTFSLPWIGEVGFLSIAISWVTLLGMLVLSFVLMFPVASVFVGIFLDDIADAVEARHYPALPEPLRLPLREQLGDSLRFLGLMVAANLLALLVYLVATVFAPLVFWGVNGFLLGREYFQLVAARRVGLEGAGRLQRRHFWQVWAAGILMAVPLTIPLINLLVPIIAVAAFTHMFHRLRLAG
ncbi:MAG: EI24 domain-containing protein [Paracoccaceae bacterium]